MKTVQQLIAELAQFPADAACYAYQDPDDTGIVVRHATEGRELGLIACDSGPIGSDKPNERRP